MIIRQPVETEVQLDHSAPPRALSLQARLGAAYDDPQKLRRRLWIDEPIHFDTVVGLGVPPGLRLQRALRTPGEVTAFINSDVLYRDDEEHRGAAAQRSRPLCRSRTASRGGPPRTARGDTSARADRCG